MAVAKHKEKLSIRERKFIKGLIAGKTPTQAMRDAGYKESTSMFMSGKKVKDLQPVIRDLMEKRGLTDDLLLKKLEEELNAEETKFFQHEGIVCDERNVIAHGPRLDALDKAFKLKGSYAPTKGELTGKDGRPLTVEVVKFSEPVE